MATTNPTERLVFVLDERTRIDYSPAKRYGDIRFVFAANADRSSIWSSSYYDDAVASMEKQQFDPDLDYFVISGAQVPLMLLATTLVARFGQVNLLLFDSSASEYVHKRVVVSNRPQKSHD